jgi:hypothetical protein
MQKKLAIKKDTFRFMMNSPSRPAFMAEPACYRLMKL